ncbi:MAG: CAP domain-containing protein [Myxococcales bacterium]|nr:CAP domain-containing protein [Myxococcales bacterium]
MLRRARWQLAIVAIIVGASFWLSQGRPTLQHVQERLSGVTNGDPVPLLPRAQPDEATQPAPDDPVAPAPGKTVRIGLSEPPAAWYLRGSTTGNERFYRRLVAEIAGDKAFVSADLGRAAREFVFQYTELGREPPTDVRDFLVRSSGALAGDTAFQHLRTTSSAEKSLRRAISLLLKDPPDGDGRLVIGIGEVFTPGRKYKRHVGVVATHLPAVIEPLARQVKPSSFWRIRGTLLASYRDLTALVLWPDGRDGKAKLTVDGAKFEVVVPTGETIGSLDVQLTGVGPRGPGKLLQFRAEVGQALPTHYMATLPPDESQINTATDAAKLAFQLLNADRRRHGLPALKWDADLAKIAEDHSRDMRDNHFFSHLSPSTGLHSARLARAGYRSSTSAENLALNVSLAEAESGLMHSLGHRRNILHRRVTHVGLGVVGEERENGQKRWWVTQLFARQVQPLDVAAERRRVMAAITEARKNDGKKALRFDSALDEVAAAAARTAIEGDLNGVTGHALRQARSRGLIRGRLKAWAALTPELDQIALPPMVRDGSARRVGLGLAQKDDTTGATALVLLVAN